MKNKLRRDFSHNNESPYGGCKHFWGRVEWKDSKIYYSIKKTTRNIMQSLNGNMKFLAVKSMWYHCQSVRISKIVKEYGKEITFYFAGRKSWVPETDPIAS